MADQQDYIIIAGALRRGAERAVKLDCDDAARRQAIVAVDYTIVQVCDALEAQHDSPYKFRRSTFLSAAGHSDPCTIHAHTHEETS